MGSDAGWVSPWSRSPAPSPTNSAQLFSSPFSFFRLFFVPPLSFLAPQRVWGGPGPGGGAWARARLAVAVVGSAPPDHVQIPAVAVVPARQVWGRRCSGDGTSSGVATVRLQGVAPSEVGLPAICPAGPPVNGCCPIDRCYPLVGRVRGWTCGSRPLLGPSGAARAPYLVPPALPVHLLRYFLPPLPFVYFLWILLTCFMSLRVQPP